MTSPNRQHRFGKRERVWRLLSELVRAVVSRSSNQRHGTIPPIWQDVQARALRAHLASAIPAQQPIE